MLEEVKEIEDITRPYQAEYFMVYGTLRMGQGNYSWALQDTADYLETKKLKGFAYAGGLSAYYSGNEEDSLTVDIFKVKPEFLQEVNRDIDRLEGGYEFKLVTLTLDTGEEVQAKFYQSRWNRSKSETGDYLIDSGRISQHGEDLMRHALRKHPQNGRKFIAFYNLDKNGKDS